MQVVIKKNRITEIAIENDLPIVALVQSVSPHFSSFGSPS